MANLTDIVKDIQDISNNERVHKVASVSTLSTAGLVEGQAVELLGYHANSTVGGGSGVITTARHNGGTAISLTRAFPTDWNDQEQLEVWFAESGSDELCSVRTNVTKIRTSYFGGSLSAADDCANSSGMKLIIDSDCILYEDLTITASVIHESGKIFANTMSELETPETLTLSCDFAAARVKVFDSSLNVVCGEGYGNDYSCPEWFSEYNVLDCYIALQKSGDMLIPVGGNVSLLSGKTYTFSDGVKFDIDDQSITLGGNSRRESSKLIMTGSGLGIWGISTNDLFCNFKLQYMEYTGPDEASGNETAVGVRFSDGWGHGCVGVTQRGFDTSRFIQFYNYDRWTEGWIIEDVVIRRPRIAVDFARDTGVTRTNTNSFGWGSIVRTNISVGSGALGYGGATGFNIASEDKGGASTGSTGANVYGINIESLVLFSELSGNVKFFTVRYAGNILTGHADISIDGIVTADGSDHQILYQRDGGFIDLQGALVHNQGKTRNSDETWRSICFTNTVNDLIDTECPCSYRGATLRIGGTVTSGTDGSFTMRLNAGASYRIKLTAEGDGTYRNAEYIACCYDGNLIAGVTKVSGNNASASISVGTYNGLSDHSSSAGNGGKVDFTLDASADVEDTVWTADIQQI